MRILASGTVFANPQPHLRTRHAFHPSLVDCGDGQLLCAYDVGEAIESMDYRTHRSRSSDGGATWHGEGPLLTAPDAVANSHTVRISSAYDQLIAFGALHHRTDPKQGFVNRQTMGFVPMDLILSRSGDLGSTWAAPQVVEPPLTGPAFEICHAVLALAPDRWLAPTATWRGWDGELPNGAKTVVLISADGGHSWPRHTVVFDGTSEQVLHWEVSVVQLAGGELLAVTWVYEPASGRHLPNRYALSHDAGDSFGAAAKLGLHGQTCKALALADGRVLFAYRRHDRPGLWAALSELHPRNGWRHIEHEPLWGGGLGTPA